MSKKKRLQSKIERTHRPLSGTQMVAGVVLLLALAAIVWIVWPKSGAAKQYDAPPPMTIDPTKEYYATVKMEKGGEFVIQLYPDKAPITVNNFVFWRGKAISTARPSIAS